ncbi:hypothetical protein Sden_2851 [Shewanella denitrificans OS217]|jgi:hypothetical protein|uniref:Uncharacterized protein n=2 Tax=Shewanella TaxID=22 RepID=Q12K96_SHEDO|nr:hypothetical protein Sden_2851 [Shewanella denitrificans OS217]
MKEDPMDHSTPSYLGILALALLMVALSISIDTATNWLSLSLEIVEMTSQSSKDGFEKVGEVDGLIALTLWLIEQTAQILQK